MESPEVNDHLPFRVLVDCNGDHVLIALSGEFGVDSRRQVDEALGELDREHVGMLVVDLSGVTFMDSTALLILVQLYRRYRDSATVSIEGGSPEIHTQFENSGLDRVMPIEYPDAGRHLAQKWGDDPTHPLRRHPHMGLPHPTLPKRRRDTRPEPHAAAQWSATRPSSGSSGRPASAHAWIPPVML